MTIFKFNNSTDKPLLNPGTYPFKVEEAENTYSKKGNAMLKLKLNVDEQVMIYDYILDSSFHVSKLKAFLNAIGMAEDFEKGAVDVMKLPGKRGKAILEIDDDPSSGFPPKNQVSFYAGNATLLAPSEPPKEEFDDPIPF